MATIAPSTAGRIEVIESIEQKTLKSSAAINAGTYVRENSSGQWEQALATSAGAAAGARLALRTVVAGEALTAMKRGVVGGFTISQAFNAATYLSDTGTVADAAGTAPVVTGRVRAATANDVTAAHDKVLEVDCPN